MLGKLRSGMKPRCALNRREKKGITATGEEKYSGLSRAESLLAWDPGKPEEDPEARSSKLNKADRAVRPGDILSVKEVLLFLLSVGSSA